MDKRQTRRVIDYGIDFLALVSIMTGGLLVGIGTIYFVVPGTNQMNPPGVIAVILGIVMVWAGLRRFRGIDFTP